MAPRHKSIETKYYEERDSDIVQGGKMGFGDPGANPDLRNPATIGAF